MPIRRTAAVVLLALACLEATGAPAAADLDRQLVAAAGRADLAAASRLLQQGASANAAIALPVFDAEPPRARLAQDEPADAGNHRHETALAAAARAGSPEIARLLLAAGADPNRAGALRAAPLHFAVARADLRLADLLLSAGARTDVRDPGGSLPLSRAASFADAALVQRLLGAGADPDGRERDGTTPLAEAVRLGRIDIARMLLDAGARVDLADREGKAPLYRAIVLQREEIALLLLERGADPRRPVDGEDMAAHARWARQDKILARIQKELR
jgi:ankyrin repeat protein